MEADNKKILLVKLRYIGDTLTLIPVIDNLMERAQGATLDVMVNKGTEEVLLHHPGVQAVWAYDRHMAKRSLFLSIRYHLEFIRKLRSRRYDIVLDLSHGDRAAFLCRSTGAPIRISYNKSSSLSHLLMNNFVYADPEKVHVVDYQLQSLRLFGWDGFNREVKVHIPDNVQSKVDELLEQCGIIGPNRQAVTIHPGARGRLRQWPPDRFAEIGRRLRSLYGVALMLIGGPREKELVGEVEDLLGQAAEFKSTALTLLEMAALLRRSRLFVGNDSAPAHMAAAVGCPGVTLFGPTFPQMWRPLGPFSEVVFADPACCGCRQQVCIHPEKTCMGLIGVEDVWEKVEKLMSPKAF